MTVYRPEGQLLTTPGNRALTKNHAALQEAYAQNRTLEARAIVCDNEHNLVVDFGFCRGVMPRALCALGIAEGTTRDIAIISRVGKPVSFRIIGFQKDSHGELSPVLSRVAVQQACMEEYVRALRPGDVIDARVTHLEPFGCFVDIGCGIPSLIPIDCISVSRISHPSDRFRIGQDIKAVVRAVDEHNRLTLSHKELLGSWEENADLFSPGETVAGVVRSVEQYGAFVELTPNLAGLAEPREGIHPGQQASVYIKSLIPQKMKVKLIIVDSFDAPASVPEPRYFITEGHLDRWVYSPADAPKQIETLFA